MTKVAVALALTAVAVLVLAGVGFAALFPSPGAAKAPVRVDAPIAAAHPTTAARPATGACPTPGGTPNWAYTSFFDDAVVNFWVPGSPSLDGSNFQTVPCNNVIPTYTNGFWMNVTTNVPITSAIIKVWGTSWPTPTNPSPDITDFGPENPVGEAMYIEPPNFERASFYFNVYRYFWPGSQVYFNITLSSTNASPSTIYSADTSSNHYLPIQWSGGVNNATWEFYVASPFAETPTPGLANFSQDIAVSTTPSVLTSPAFEPNRVQTLQIQLASINYSGVLNPIPRAEGQFTLSGNITGVYYQYFGPNNHTVMTLDTPLGPYPGTHVQFNITAYLPWEGGAIDRIYSPVYSFNWSNQGGWAQSSNGLTANLLLNSTPDVTGTSSTTALSTGTPVNITIDELTPNITIGSAGVHFRYADANGVSYGEIPMIPVTKNISYALIPGLPPGSGVVFSVQAKDIFGNPIASGNYSYTEGGSTGPTLQSGYGMFYFEAINLATGALVPNINFTVANDTWSEAKVGTPLGFAAPIPASGVGELAVAYGTYTVTVHAFGQSQSWTGTVSSADPFVVTFYLTSAPVNELVSVPLPTLTVAAALGLVGAALAAWPVVSWFRERRKKAEAEQRRISL